MGAFRIGRIAGIDIRIHWSWFAIFFLLIWWLADGFFGEVDAYSDWTAAQRWTASVITTCLFFGSVLLHELSHSLVARRLGLPVTSITLFIFGGVSALGAEPESAKQEFRVAIVGPLTSFALGAVFAVLYVIFWQLGSADSAPSAIAQYLALINVAVGIFNMLPGFPLDGGRVLRASLWARSGNMLKATKLAAGAGAVISFALIAAGVILVLGGHYINGVWFIVIGWFLRNTSDSAYQQLVMRTSLEGAYVGEMVNRSFRSASPDIMLSDLVAEYLLGYGQRCVPIAVAGNLLGLLCMSDLKRVPQDQWQTTSVFRAMTPMEKLHVVGPQDELTRALEMMATHDVHQLPVIEQHTFIGFVTRADVIRRIQIKAEVTGA